MTGPLYGRPYTGDEMDLAHQGYHEARTRPKFTTRPTVTGGEVEGIVIMVNGHDLAAIFPRDHDQCGGDCAEWELGYWDAETDEWVEAGDDEGFTVQVRAFLAREPS